MSQTVSEFLKNYEDIRFGKPATMEEIRNAEKQLNLKFADDFIECVSTYNYVTIGGYIASFGICDFDQRSVVAQTMSMWGYEIFDHVPRNLYVIEDIGIEAVLICQDQTGAIYEVAPYYGPKKIADSLVQYFDETVEMFKADGL